MEDKNEEAMCLQLDLVDEARATTEQRLARYQNLMSKYYNSKVRHRDFQIGDLVLRKVMGAAKTLHKESLDQIRKGIIGSRHGRGRAPTTSKQWTDRNFSTHGTRNTFGNTTSRDDGRRLPPIPQFIYFFTSLSLKF